MIEELKIDRFKSFLGESIRFSPLTLILGPNGAGKSNLFDALRFLRFMGDGVPIRDAIEGHATPVPSGVTVPGIRGGQREIVHFDSPDQVFTLGIRVRTEEGGFSYVIGVDAKRYRVVREELRDEETGQYVFSTHPDPNPLTHDDDAPFIEARFYKRQKGPNPKRQFNAGVSILSQFEGRRAESRANEDVADQVRSELRSLTPLELRPEVLREYAPSGSTELGEHGENFPAVVFDLEFLAEMGDPSIYTPDEITPDEEEAYQRLEAIKSWLAELTPQAIVEITTESSPTGERIFGVTERVGGPVITARSLSDGTLRFAALAFAVIGSAGRTTLLIEELENGINPTRVSLVLQMLVRATNVRPQVQVLASTHSPTLLNLTRREQVMDSVLIGWDSDARSSRAIPIRDIPNIEATLDKTAAGELQTEGWFEFTALT